MLCTTDWKGAGKAEGAPPRRCMNFMHWAIVLHKTPAPIPKQGQTLSFMALRGKTHLL